MLNYLNFYIKNKIKINKFGVVFKNNLSILNLF